MALRFRFCSIVVFPGTCAGLFHRAIMSSGSALSPWVLAHSAVAYSRKLAAAVACPNEAGSSGSAKNAALVDCLRQKSIEQLLSVPFDAPAYLTSFGPTIDGIGTYTQPYRDGTLRLTIITAIFVPNNGYANQHTTRNATHSDTERAGFVNGRARRELPLWQLRSLIWREYRVYRTLYSIPRFFRFVSLLTLMAV